ncbi:piggyBac transposable element-derived protein 4-like [Lepeophtheirus salmonis]|uniref:piggyBac transposable element-derived protein 4-like n=1 Tax=Lepeophtheirus salmonis TaxID=72036 RepID=UPI003AF37673
MSKEKLSIEEIRHYLECTSYSDSEGEDFELGKDEEYVQPPQSSSSDSDDYSDVFDKSVVDARSKLKNDVWTTSKREILQLIAIMYARGILAKGQPTEVIWSRTLGINLFRNTIPHDKYKELLRYIRFDIRSTRSQRLQNDKFALISMVWDRFVENCKSSYRPGENITNITFDEQLFPTKARYPFTQYMAKKPDKFDIKFWLAVDASSKYLVNGFSYLGKDSQRPANKFLSEYIVMKLMEPYLDKGRNVTTNNFFTSLSLANELQKNRTTILGTMNRARKEIPSELKATKQALFSSLIFVNSGKTLTFYQGKKKQKCLNFELCSQKC